LTVPSCVKVVLMVQTLEGMTGVAPILPAVPVRQCFACPALAHSRAMRDQADPKASHCLVGAVTWLVPPDWARWLEPAALAAIVARLSAPVEQESHETGMKEPEGSTVQQVSAQRSRDAAGSSLAAQLQPDGRQGQPGQ
jgi:hypothetical protein